MAVQVGCCVGKPHPATSVSVSLKSASISVQWVMAYLSRSASNSGELLIHNCNWVGVIGIIISIIIGIIGIIVIIVIG